MQFPENHENKRSKVRIEKRHDEDHDRMNDDDGSQKYTQQNERDIFVFSHLFLLQAQFLFIFFGVYVSFRSRCRLLISYHSYNTTTIRYYTKKMKRKVH